MNLLRLAMVSLPLALTLTTPTYAGNFEISSTEALYNTDPESCITSGNHVTVLSYFSREVRWGARLTLVSGYSGEDWCGGCEPPYHDYYEWGFPQEQEMKAIAPWTWEVSSQTYGYPSGAGGRLKTLNFAVKIEGPDGRITWDNGGSSYGCYQVDLSRKLCDPSIEPYKTYRSRPKNLPVTIVPK